MKKLYLNFALNQLVPKPRKRTLPILTLSFMLCSIVSCHKESSTSSVSSADETQCQSSLALTGEDQPKYDFVFPDGIEAYEAGTKVLQLKTGRTYECKGFPYTQYCRQWSVASTRFEPGTGSNWIAAWDLK